MSGTSTGTQKEPSAADLLREQRLQRNLKIVVAGLGALILIGLGAVVARVLTMSSGQGGLRSHATPVASQSAGGLAVEIPKGARIVSTSLSGSRLAVHYDGPSGTGIAIIDLDTGRRVIEVKPVEALPRN